MTNIDKDKLIEVMAKALYYLEPDINSLGRKTEWCNLNRHSKGYHKKQAEAVLIALCKELPDCEAHCKESGRTLVNLVKMQDIYNQLKAIGK